MWLRTRGGPGRRMASAHGTTAERPELEPVQDLPGEASPGQGLRRRPVPWALGCSHRSKNRSMRHRCCCLMTQDEQAPPPRFSCRADTALLERHRVHQEWNSRAWTSHGFPREERNQFCASADKFPPSMWLGLPPCASSPPWGDRSSWERPGASTSLRGARPSAHCLGRLRQERPLLCLR